MARRKATMEDYPPPVGSKMWTTFGHELDKLYHVRAHVDGRLVLRWYSKSRGWQYVIEGLSWYMSFHRHLEIDTKPR